MKILHFLVTDRLSGAENVVIDILSGLKENNEVYYVSPYGPIRDAVEKRGINFIACDTEKIPEIKIVYKEIKPDIVHACDPRMSFKCALAGIPFISHLHANCPWMKKPTANSAALLYTIKKAEAVITVSESIGNEYIFKKALSKKLHVVENVVNSEKVLAAAKEPFDEKYDLVFVGRLSEAKRPLTFLELVKAAQREYPSLRAAMVGDGEMRADVERYIKDTGLQNVTLRGFEDNPYKIIDNSSVCVMTSLYEGFGLAAVESMILSKPVVAFPVGGLCDIVTESSGKLCRDVEEMKNEVVRLLCDKDYYTEKSEGARKNSARFCSYSAYISKIRDIYREVIKNRADK